MAADLRRQAGAALQPLIASSSRLTGEESLGKEKGRHPAVTAFDFPAFESQSAARSCFERRDRLVLAVGAGGQDGAVALGGDRLQPVHHAAGARRDQAADDDVLLEALQRVDPARDGRLGQHARGLLERGRRDERLGLQAGLGDAEQHRVGLGRLQLLGRELGVLELELLLVDLLADQEGRIRRRR